MRQLHIGIIMDGNRRFAKRLMKEPWKGHELGTEKVKNLLEWCKEFQVKELTLYCLSLENLNNRPKKELDYLMNLFKKEIKNLKEDKKIHENKIKIRFIGKREVLEEDIQKSMKEIEDLTKDYNDYIINLAIAYGGRQEIIQAVKKTVENNQEINEENIQSNLSLKDSPDLIIRTGGEKRTSNFLPWQAIYSEWVYLDKMWPEFSKEDLKKAIDDFKSRERRFGK